MACNKHLKTSTPQLAYEITPKFLRDQFRGAGEILRVNLERDKEGKSKGFGTVTYAYPDMALRCIDMFNQKSIKGRRLSVRLVSFNCLLLFTLSHFRVLGMPCVLDLII